METRQLSIRFTASLLLVLLALATANAAEKTTRAKKKDTATVTNEVTTPVAPVTFAPVPAGHPLEGMWNDPTFRKSLLGSYGFLSDVEPKLTTEEQAVYRDKIAPLLREDPAKAVPELGALIKPDSSALFDYTLATIYFQAADMTNAIKHYEAAIAKFPDFRRAQRNLGLALVREGQYAEAVKPLARTIALGGGDGKVFGLLGFSYVSLNQFMSAESAYRQALFFEPENLDFQLGMVKCQIALAQYDAALASLDELLQKYPERDNLWALQANVFVQKDQPNKAAVNFEILRKLGKATPQNLMLLGDIYMTREAKDLALSAYLEAIAKDEGKNASRSLRAAEILTSRGAWTEAEQLFAKIRAVSGTNLETADELKLLRLESKVALARGESEKGIQVLEQIIQRNPLDAEALLMAGDHYAKNGQREKAEFRYETAGKISGFEAEALVKQAQLLVQSGKYNPALELLRKAQKIHPRDHVQRYLDRVEQVARNTRS